MAVLATVIFAAACRDPGPDIDQEPAAPSAISLYTPITVQTAAVDVPPPVPIIELRAGGPAPLADLGPTSLPMVVSASAVGIDRCDNPLLHVYASAAAMRFSLESALVHAVIRAESACNSGAVSNKGARGLMQLMPQFGARDAYLHLYGMDGIPTNAALADPKVNVLLGVAYLRKLFDEFAFIPQGEPQMRVVLAAWNWGPARVVRRLPQFGGWTERDHRYRWAEWTHRRTPAETRAFTARVLRLRYAYRDAHPPETQPPIVAAATAPAADFFRFGNVYTATYP